MRVIVALNAVAALLIGYARVSTDGQDLTVQREALAALGVSPARTYVDHGLTGTNRDRPGLREAMAACRDGDTLVVTKLDRLARSLPDARAILAELTARQVKLNRGGSVHDPTDPVGRLLFNVLAMVAEFESDLEYSAASDLGLQRVVVLSRSRLTCEAAVQPSGCAGVLSEGGSMIPTMILFGLVFGRWWRSAIAASAVVWAAFVLTPAEVTLSDAGVLGGAAALGAANAAVGVSVYQAGLWLVRRLRLDQPVPASSAKSQASAKSGIDQPGS